MSDNESDDKPTREPQGSGQEPESAAGRPQKEPSEGTAAESSERATPSEPPERAAPSEPPERTTPSEPPERTAPSESPAGSMTPLAGPDPTGPTRSRMSGSRFWLIPALTFLVGVALGGVVVAVSNGGGEDTGSSTATSETAATSAPTTSTETSGRAPATVTVPGPCLQLADDSDVLLEQVNQVAEAARDLDAERLSELVRDLQQSRDLLQEDSQACREAGIDVTSSS
jgi:hypothetical protein